MTTLYPPYIVGKLPAQYGDTLRIPFSFNKAGGFINQSAKNEMVLKLRTVTTDKNPLAIEGNDEVVLVSDYANSEIAQFTLSSSQLEKFLPGQFYKAQLQLREGENLSPFSTVGVFKYIEIVPNAITISDLDSSQTNSLKAEYKGTYQISENDPFEKVVEYKFNIFREGELVESTEWQMHSAITDSDNESYDLFIPQLDLEDGSTYQIQYSIRTINNYTASSPYYILKNHNLFPMPELPGTVVAQNNYDNGSITIQISNGEDERVLCGEYEFFRREADNGGGWQKIGNAVFDKVLEPYEVIFKLEDFNIEQGVVYQYAMAQVDRTPGVNLITDKFIFSTITADFEDMFLWDDTMRLRLRYNPKITSFKQTTLEQKMDTLGGRYPVFFRNGRVQYKEFPISALITLLMEENEVQEQGRQKTPNQDEIAPIGFRTNVNGYNIYNEREYKIKVLEWLNNGKPKVFSSPTEGKFLVRLMGVSLSPMEQLGRMLHTFSATAYEIGPSNYSSLLEKKIISDNIIEKIDNLKVEQRILLYGERFNTTEIIQANITNANPGTKVLLTYKNSVSPVQITIGTTGYYNIHIEKNNPLISIEVLEERDSAVPVSGGLAPVDGIVINYSYCKNSRYPILYDGQIVNGIRYVERVEQYASKEIIGTTKIGVGNASNITYLRITKKFIQKIESIEELPPYNSNNYLHTLYQLGNDFCYMDENGNPTYASVNPSYNRFKCFINGDTMIDLEQSGLVSYAMNGIAVNSIEIGNGLYANIVYTEIQYDTEEVK